MTRRRVALVILSMRLRLIVYECVGLTASISLHIMCLVRVLCVSLSLSLALRESPVIR